MSRKGISFAGQMAIVLAVALLAAQSVNFLLLLEARQRVEAARNEAMIDRFVARAQAPDRVLRILERRRPPRLRDRLDRPPEPPTGEGEEGGERLEGRFGGRVTVSGLKVAAGGELDEGLTALLVEKLEANGLASDGARVSRLTRRFRPDEPSAVILSAPLNDGKWFNLVQPVPPNSRLRIVPLILQTVLLYVGLMAAVLFVTARLSRPLRRLENAAASFSLGEADDPLPLEGPSDVRSLTEAFEGMRGRLRRAFNEKDVMLGAIGHDLRTPLTSLRIRVEQVEDEKLRSRMAATIEELSILLDDILVLARDGTAGAPAVALDVSALAEAVTEDLMGEGVPLGFEGARATEAPAHPALLRRALRNLISNGLRYGGEVVVRIETDADTVTIAVDDNGPGVPEDELQSLREPFVRGEASRNRETGGAGLGLAIADGAARAHKGQLILENRPAGGFRAALRLPR